MCIAPFWKHLNNSDNSEIIQLYTGSFQIHKMMTVLCTCQVPLENGTKSSHISRNCSTCTTNKLSHSLGRHTHISGVMSYPPHHHSGTVLSTQPQSHHDRRLHVEPVKSPLCTQRSSLRKEEGGEGRKEEAKKGEQERERERQTQNGFDDQACVQVVFLRMITSTVGYHKSGWGNR